MEKYNYSEAVKAGILAAIADDDNLRRQPEETSEDYAERLNDALWINDAVTGNGSGSFTFSSWEAEENLIHNTDLLAEALEEFGQADENPLERGAEWCDVTIRCYLLGGCIWDLIDNGRI